MKKNSSLALKSGRPSAAREKAPTLSRLAAQKELKRVNFVIEAEEHRRLKIYAAQQGKTITTLLMQYVSKLTSERKDKNLYE